MKLKIIGRLVPIIAILVLACFFVGGCGMQTLGPGEVGVKYNLYGGHKGVTQSDVVRGQVFYNGITERIYPFEVAYKRVVWNGDKSGDEGVQLDQSIPVSTKDGVGMCLDVAITYRVKEDSVPSLFMQYKKDSDAILSGVVRDELRKMLATECSKLTAMDLRTANQVIFLGKVCQEMDDSPIGKDGFDFRQLVFTGRPRFADPKMEDNINRVAQAKLNAQAEQENVKKEIALASQKIARAQGQSRANSILANSLSDKNIRWQQLQNQSAAIDKWNGKLPDVTSGGVPFIQLGH